MVTLGEYWHNRLLIDGFDVRIRNGYASAICSKMLDEEIGKHAARRNISSIELIIYHMMSTWGLSSINDLYSLVENQPKKYNDKHTLYDLSKLFQGTQAGKFKTQLGKIQKKICLERNKLMSHLTKTRDWEDWVNRNSKFNSSDDLISLWLQTMDGFYDILPRSAAVENAENLPSIKYYKKAYSTGTKKQAIIECADKLELFYKKIIEDLFLRCPTFYTRDKTPESHHNDS